MNFSYLRPGEWLAQTQNNGNFSVDVKQTRQGLEMGVVREVAGKLGISNFVVKRKRARQNAVKKSPKAQ